MAKLPDYLHGAYGVIHAEPNRSAANGRGAVVYIGTAPVHTVAGGGSNVNKPVLVRSINEARKYFGYSDNWDDYTLCEAMKVHLEDRGVGPLVLINVLDPATHKAEEATSAQLTPVNGRVTIANAESVIFDTVRVTGKTAGTDYVAAYDYKKKVITLTELTSGALGTTALTVTYNTVTPAAVTSAAVIGASDGNGLNTGLYAIKNVEQETGFLPSYIVCPGFSSVPDVHTAMGEVSQKINGHWDAWLFTDLPLKNGVTPLTLDTIGTYRTANGYTLENETVSFPMVTGTDGKHYHLSVLRAANFQALLIENEGIPYHSASNTDCDIISNLWFGADNTGRVYDDSLINEKLNRIGIASAAFLGGRWCLWGAAAAAYDPNDQDDVSLNETNRMMLYYVSNDFQHRRARDVDKPLTPADLQTMVAEEQARLEALVKIGALTFGEAYINADYINRSDMRRGDYQFTFNVTTTPLAKSLRANVAWVDTGYEIYYDMAQ